MKEKLASLQQSIPHSSKPSGGNEEEGVLVDEELDREMLLTMLDLAVQGAISSIRSARGKYYHFKIDLG